MSPETKKKVLIGGGVVAGLLVLYYLYSTYTANAASSASSPTLLGGVSLVGNPPPQADVSPTTNVTNQNQPVSGARQVPARKGYSGGNPQQNSGRSGTITKPFPIGTHISPNYGWGNRYGGGSPSKPVMF